MRRQVDAYREQQYVLVSTIYSCMENGFVYLLKQQYYLSTCTLNCIDYSLSHISSSPLKPTDSKQVLPDSPTESQNRNVVSTQQYVQSTAPSLSNHKKAMESELALSKKRVYRSILHAHAVPLNVGSISIFGETEKQTPRRPRRLQERSQQHEKSHLEVHSRLFCYGKTDIVKSSGTAMAAQNKPIAHTQSTLSPECCTDSQQRNI